MSEFSTYNASGIAAASTQAQATFPTSAQALDHGPYSGARILLVEADKAVSAMLCEWLQNENYKIDVEVDGAGALEKLYKESYDLIIVNRQLTDVSGIDVCLRYRAFGGETPMIVTSNIDSIDDKEQCFEAGVNDYLVKPYNLREISARIRAKIRRAKAFDYKG
jgi:DNA-binding response OmpR family regulator